jgi:hypothetical protein
MRSAEQIAQEVAYGLGMNVYLCQGGTLSQTPPSEGDYKLIRAPATAKPLIWHGTIATEPAPCG